MNVNAVEQCLANTLDPVVNQPLLSVASITGLSGDSQQLELELTFGYPIAGVKTELEQHLQSLLAEFAEKVTLNMRWQVNPAGREFEAAGKATNLIAVASGKGGVGKSTTTVNLALALAAEGAAVGLLDADIYGPSIGQMLGAPEGTRPEVLSENSFAPVKLLGIESMSMAFLATADTPMVWRGPMAGGALQQLLKQTQWGGLDYLLVDMPPGTGDIQLTLSQQAPLAGAVIVTTPQNIALLDAVKGVEMFRKVNVPVLGVVENMAYHSCSNCGHQDPVFGTGGGAKMSAQYEIPLLGQLPLNASIREQADSGLPTVAAEPEGEIAAIYRTMARTLAGKLAVMATKNATGFPKISIDAD